MKNLLLFLSEIILFWLIFFPARVYALDSFSKDAANPQIVNYLSDNNSFMHVHIFKQNNRLKGIFTVKDKSGDYVLILGEQTSSTEWTMQKKIWEDGPEISGARVLFLDTSHIRLFYTKFDNHYKIYFIDCDINFNCQGSPNLVFSNTQSWEYRGVDSAFPYFKDGVYYLFFDGWGNTFKIEMATSTDGVNWTRCVNNPIIEYAGGPFLFEKNNKFYLFYHAPAGEGIIVAESSDPLSCFMHWQKSNYILFPDKNYDQNHLIFPSIIERGNTLNLYYSGKGANGVWGLNLATSTLPKENVFYLIIPGFFASWNKDAILHNKLVSIFDWKLPGYVKEYTGLKQSLINSGLIENQDFILFPYDWRKSVDNTVDDLDNFLQEKIWKNDSTKKIKIIGHSLGGLIARIYMQKYPNRNVDKVITVGTPNKGVVQVYEPLVTGEIERENTFLWLIEKIMVFINKINGETDKETIARSLPVLYDFLPTFNFLKKQNDQEINIDDMLTNNLTLRRYNNSLPNFFSKLVAIYGEKDAKTPAGYVVNEPILNNQGVFSEDPLPISKFFDVGDYTVLSQSGKDERDPDYQKLPLDHNELIYKKEGIEKILEVSGINYDESLIIEGKKTEISPALVFMMQSPAQMEVSFGGKTYQEEDGIIFIPGAESGQYTIKIKGLDVGKYTVTIGKISKNNDLWSKIEGIISQDPPSGQIDNYTLDFDSDSIGSPTPTNIPILSSMLAPTETIVTKAQPSISPMSTPTPSLTPTPPEVQQGGSTEAISNNTFEKSNDNKQGEVLGEKEKSNPDVFQPTNTSKKIIYLLLTIFLAASCVIFYFYKKYPKQNFITKLKKL